MASILSTGQDDDETRMASALAGLARPPNRLVPPPANPAQPAPVWDWLQQAVVPNLADPAKAPSAVNMVPGGVLGPQQGAGVPAALPEGVTGEKLPDPNRNLGAERIAGDVANIASLFAGGGEGAIAAGLAKVVGSATAAKLATLGILPSARAGMAALTPVKGSPEALRAALLGPTSKVTTPAASISEEASRAVREGAMPKGAAPAKTSTAIPDIRGMPVDEAIAIARTQPHLIPSNAASEGAYVGSPRTMRGAEDLNAQREFFDRYVAADPRGGDWYDRYRADLAQSTGNDPVKNLWAANQHGQWSAGVDPGSELHYVLKEANSAIAGMPERANYGAQHRAHLRSLAQKDPSLYQLADKTYEYAQHVNPNQGVPTATGVNDFRHMRNWGYTDTSGLPQRGAATPGQHRFLDMETALAVDRANKTNLGGRSDWTGEQLQAAPWVRQKALDFMKRNKALTYDQAFDRANKTIGDFYPSKIYGATHEAQPGANVTGHMSLADQAEQAVKDEYFHDPGSTWKTAPGGRDAIYSGLGNEGTGNFMRVLPTEPMQGMYRRADGKQETNLGEIARPLGTFTTGKPKKGEPFKRATDADQAILTAGEHLRAALDAQNAGSWNKPWLGGPAKQSNSLYYPKTGGPASLGELLAAQSTGTPHGLPDTSASSGGAIQTQFYPAPEGSKGFDKAFRSGGLVVPGFEPPMRVRVDSGLADLVGLWQNEGSGDVTREVLKHINATPELRSAFNNNPYLPERALAKFERDQRWSSRWGAPRQDIQNLRQIVGTAPPGQWIDAVEAALKAGKVALPAVALLLTGAAALSQQEGGQQTGGSHEAL